MGCEDGKEQIMGAIKDGQRVRTRRFTSLCTCSDKFRQFPATGVTVQKIVQIPQVQVMVADVLVILQRQLQRVLQISSLTVCWRL